MTIGTLIIFLTIFAMVESRAMPSDENNINLCGRKLMIRMLHICDKTTPLRCLELEDFEDENLVNEETGVLEKCCSSGCEKVQIERLCCQKQPELGTPFRPHVNKHHHKKTHHMIPMDKKNYPFDLGY